MRNSRRRWQQVPQADRDERAAWLRERALPQAEEFPPRPPFRVLRLAPPRLLPLLLAEAGRQARSDHVRRNDLPGAAQNNPLGHVAVPESQHPRDAPNEASGS